ncbi:hypothetical protein VTK73DRAFT_8274 [Phialemonium thermophilum]|uniref:FAD-binding domain-containing protein n=1 Tax=Phialemonium thermophilum TaxID=223376 RepID=A0ABR3W9G3_9PEZI
MGDGSLIVAASAVQASPDWFLPQDRDGGKQDDANSETKKSRNLGSRIIDDPEEAARIRSSLVEEGGPFADWHPLLQDAIRRSAGRCVARSLYVLPVGFRWKHRRGITLVGDAAHLMTPYAGEGVNVAMEDALKLARAITDGKPADGDGGDALDAAVVAYEEEMWPRAEKVARLADELLKLWMFSGKVTRSVVAAAIALHAKFQTPRLLHPVASALSYALVYGQSILG